MWKPKLVILDEPTAALGVAQTRQVLDLISRLREQGLAVIVISHNLEDVFSVVDRIKVLRLGRNGGNIRRSRCDSPASRGGDHRRGVRPAERWPGPGRSPGGAT